MAMRIGFDVNPLITHSHRGIGQTTYSMTGSLIEATSPGRWDGDWLGLYIDRKYSRWVAGYTLFSSLIATPTGARPAVVREVGDPAGLPAQVRRDGLDLFHLNDYFYPLYRAEDVRAGAFHPTRLVLTVRDIYPILVPDENQGGYERLRAHMLPVLDRLDRVIAISAWTREELIGHLGLDADRIEVIHHGVDRVRFRPRPAATLYEFRRRYNLGRPFILYAAALGGRKNQELLVKAFARFARELPAQWDLVLAGPGTPRRDLLQAVAEGGVEGRVRFPGYVPPAELPLLYSAAAIFAFPSLYEGFGNPVLEAMASGVPVVAARAASIPEVAGDAALLVDPGDVTAWVDALLDLATRPLLRAMLREKGLQRVWKFSWEQATRRMLECYLRVLDGPPRLPSPDQDPPEGR